ncbi:MAG: hypothetical protein ACLQU4_00875 [Limisphaerales bacterium]
MNEKATMEGKSPAPLPRPPTAPKYPRRLTILSGVVLLAVA